MKITYIRHIEKKLLFLKKICINSKNFYIYIHNNENYKGNIQNVQCSKFT